MASRLERLIALDTYIRGGSYPSVYRLCEVFEVQQRTIYQDLKELRERFGLDIRFDRERNGYYNADTSKRLPPMAITEDESLLLLSAIHLLGHLGGASFYGALANTVELLHESSNGLGARLAEIIDLPPQQEAVSTSIFLTALRACLTGKPVTLNDGAMSPVEARAVKLKLTSEGWALVCADGASGETIYPLSKLHRVLIKEAERPVTE